MEESKKLETKIQNLSIPKGKHAFDCSGTIFVIDERYQFIQYIGYGAFGVFCSVSDKQTGQKRVVKKVPQVFDDLLDAKRLLKDIKVMSHFDHENILKVVDLIKPESNTGYKDLYIVTELMETDLHHELSDEHFQYFVYQILRGLLYMHSANIVHKDLKPSNMLLNTNCDLKICNLYLAENDGESHDTDKNVCYNDDYVVVRWYRAPEVLLGKSRITTAVDIWSVGCIFAELLGRTVLFPGSDYLNQIERIIRVTGFPSEEDLSSINSPDTARFSNL